MKNTQSLYLATAALAAFCVSTPAHAEDPAPPTTTKWASSAAAGLTLTRGNSDTLLATFSLGTAKKWDQNELSLGADGTYGQTKETVTVVTPGGTFRTTDNHTTAQSAHAFGQYNRLFTERWYGYGRVEGLYDKVADIKYRLTLSPGAGYYFIKEKTTDLSAEAGPALITQKLGDESKTYLTLRVGEKLHHALSDRARVWEMVEFLPQVDDFNNYIVNAEVGIEADINSTGKLSLRTVLQDTYNNVPAKGREKNDAKLIAAIAYKF